MIGIEIGASSVRVVDVVRRRQGPPLLRRFGQEGLPRGAVRGGVVHDEASVVKAVKAAAKSASVRGRSVSVTATSVHTVVRELAVPELTVDELRGALGHLARDVVPIPIERAVLDFAPTARNADGRITDGYLVALPADDVTGVVAAVEQAGFSVEGVDLGIFSLLRALAETRGAVAVATVDLGASVTTLVLERDGVPALVRVLTRGGDDVTMRLAERLGVSYVEAEERKRRAGLAGDDRDVAEICAEALRPLVGDLRSSLDYFRSSAQHSSVLIDRMRITGGGSLLPGLDGFLSHALGIPAERHGGLGFVEASPREGLDLFAPVAGAVIGLSLEGAHG